MIVQLMSEPLSWRSFARLGSAMFTAVMSRMTISWAISRTTQEHAAALAGGRLGAAGSMLVAPAGVVAGVAVAVFPP